MVDQLFMSTPTSPPSTWIAGEAIKGIPRDQVVIATKWGRSYIGWTEAEVMASKRLPRPPRWSSPASDASLEVRWPSSCFAGLYFNERGEFVTDGSRKHCRCGGGGTDSSTFSSLLCTRLGGAYATSIQAARLSTLARPPLQGSSGEEPAVPGELLFCRRMAALPGPCGFASASTTWQSMRLGLH